MSTPQQSSIVTAPAGTVLVVDAQAGTVLLLRRLESLRFMGGYWVFPGGAVDDADRAQAGAGASAVQAAAHAGCRELHEEAGLRVSAADLVHWAHWITPSGATRRFDTHFFVALRPPDQTAHLASAESSELRWLAPEWVVREPRDFPVTAPTLVELRLLAAVLADLQARGAEPAALLERARARTVRSVMPKLYGRTAVLPWDAEYPALPGEGIAWDDAACAERAGWPSRWPAPVAPRQ